MWSSQLVPQSDFKVNFLYEKSSKSFWFFFNVNNSLRQRDRTQRALVNVPGSEKLKIYAVKSTKKAIF